MLVFQNETVAIFQSSLYQTTSTLIDAETALILIDPAWLPVEVSEIQKHVAAIQRERLLYLLFTHSDFDHIIGYGAFPDAKVIASAAFADHPVKGDIINQIQAFDTKYYLKRNYPISYPKVDQAIAKDGEVMKIGSCDLRFYLAPGHTGDGLITVIEPGGIMVAGDYLSDVEFPFIYDDYACYLETIKKMKNILDTNKIQLLIPGHGNMTSSTAEMKKRVEQSQLYLQSLKQEKRKVEEELSKKYDFFEGMKETHLDNLKEAGKQR